MKKIVKIEMYLDCTNEWGDSRWNYVTSVWGDYIEFVDELWYLRDSDNHLVCCGLISELHGYGADEYEVKFKNAVSY